MFTTRISIFITVLSYVLFGNQITAEKVNALSFFTHVLSNDGDKMLGIVKRPSTSF